jgi:hypothetical protein
MEGAENQATGEPVNQQEGEADVTEQAAALALPGDDLTLRLQDAGQGAQPLRLLKCGHVFHVSPTLDCCRSGTDDLTSTDVSRKRASIRGCSMYRAAVQYVSDPFANRQIRQAQNRKRALRAGGGSEEAGGEDPRDRWTNYQLNGFTLWCACYSVGLVFTWCLLCTMYNMCKYDLIPPTCSRATLIIGGICGSKCQGVTFLGSLQR